MRWLVVACLLALAVPVEAQWRDPDQVWDRDQWEHVAGGTVVALTAQARK